MDWGVALEGRGHVRRYSRGSALFHEGGHDDVVFVVRRGRVRLSLLTPSGRTIVLAIAGPGALLGELSSIDGRPRSASATALEPVEVTAVEASAFRTVLDEVPGLASTLLRDVIAMVRTDSSLRVEREGSDLATRVASWLVRLADRASEFTRGGPCVIDLSQDDLAGLVGCSREEVNRTLGRMRDAGLVATSRGKVEVLDLERLRRPQL